MLCHICKSFIIFHSVRLPLAAVDACISAKFIQYARIITSDSPIVQNLIEIGTYSAALLFFSDSLSTSRIDYVTILK